ncbi:Peptide hydrolase [Mycena venus]|uniref:Peptide hydrolase n=1 Tax=Mycena venus TaxID=2733690 RepID=A0A8H6XAZ8_9AGAR|nr:Peptide hydrolase [Mycena venus]
MIDDPPRLHWQLRAALLPFNCTMQIVEGIAKVFAFRTLPTTVLAVVVYIVLYGAVQYGDRVPKVPKNQKGLDLAQAYADLHHIAERPHPVLSHANDIVHDYILNRVGNISSGIDFIEVHDDHVSNASWAAWGSGGSAVYYEATNILVKIQGSDPDYAPGSGVLFSAHYDSVSTASGATDDGMGVATLIQLVEYLARNRPKRTAVFNINNGEEDGLCGAFTFLKHPWSTLTDTFLNLEGAAAGGRPLLFRGTSTPALRSFHVPHPHGNVLSADAFARGVIRSGTDYTVYTGAGMEGLDLAFYRGRSKYHTKYDAIPYTDAQERALWAMMESARGSALSLLNDDRTHGSGSPPVYFDLFGAWLVVLSMDSLLIANIVLLIVGPVILLVLVVADAAVLQSRSQNRNGHVSEYNNNLLQQFWAWLISFSWLKGAWMWAKFWAAVLVTAGLQAVLMFGYLKLNPFIVYSQPTLVVVSSFTLTYLSLVFVITPSSKHLPEKQKHIMFLQTYIFTWLLLIGATVAVSSGIGGVYFVTAWNIAVLLACVIGCIENMLGAQGSYDTHHVHYAPLPQHDEEEHPRTEAETEAEPTETTPLIRPILRTKDESGAIGWWILQFILAVSVPVTLVAHIIVLSLAATAQTLTDGSSAVTVYAGISILVFMMVLPVIPFTFKIHSAVASLFVIIFVFSTVSNLFAFPFSQTEPLKVFFQQTVDLGNISSPHPPSQITHATTTLTGVKHFMKDLIIPKLPSAIGQNVTCGYKTINGRQVGLQTCKWDSTLLPSPKSDSASPVGADRLMGAHVARLSANSARFTVWAPNTRACRLYFDNDKHIKSHNVLGSEGGMLPQFPAPAGGVNQLDLWTRRWDRIFEVDVEWEGDAALEGRVACELAEYESGSIGVDAARGRIPAFEEALAFFPKWAAVTKRDDGLVEVYGRFSI